LGRDGMMEAIRLIRWGSGRSKGVGEVTKLVLLIFVLWGDL